MTRPIGMFPSRICRRSPMNCAARSWRPPHRIQNGARWHKRSYGPSSARENGVTRITLQIEGALRHPALSVDGRRWSVWACGAVDNRDLGGTLRYLEDLDGAAHLQSSEGGSTQKAARHKGIRLVGRQGYRQIRDGGANGGWRRGLSYSTATADYEQQPNHREESHDQHRITVPIGERPAFAQLAAQDSRCELASVREWRLP
jgi:hypothetical protein